jgi:tetratricopeptide (TPR) repeat protein
MNDLSPLEAVFFAALEKGSAEERAAYLDQACTDDPDLRRRVEKMLAAQSDAKSFLERPASAFGVTVDEPIPEKPGTVIGPYKLLEQIGEGGFGVVFMAEQTQPVRRKVALKILKPGMDTRQVIARFEAERQALAIMDHPNIAKVLDGGQTASGRPYFVMDLVKGLPITEHCDQAQLTPRQRLELFVQVCQAVQHAHQKGVIHRDLKPSNVLVTVHDTVPVVKVIDFGVAKALGQELTDKTLFTGFAQMVGTPLYMSPEQAGQSGVDVDTRSDIYSLGVLLYELLTGTTPFDKARLKELGYDELRRIVREEEPPKPSTRISTLGKAATTVSAQRKSDPKRLSKLFRGELDWIVMKCLEKDRNRRYETASTLAADVQHYLRDEPVLACPPSAAYRLRKFVRRYKTRLTTTGVIVLALLGVAGTLGWSLWREQEATREQALRDAALDASVKNTLDEAETFARDAKIAEFSAAIGRAEKLLKAAGREGFPVRLLELKNELAVAQDLEDIDSNPKTEEFLWGHEADAAYVKAFAKAGIDVTASPAEAAERIRARTIRRELVRALDRWAFMRHRSETHGGGTKTRPDWKQLLGIAAAADVDPDGLRNQVREALKQVDNRKTLQSLAATADVRRLPVESLVLLANALYESGGKDEAMGLSRRAVLVHPGNWWLTHHLGYWSLIAQPPQYDEAIRYSTACMAVRPRNPHTLINMGKAQREKKALPEALATFSHLLELHPTEATAWKLRGLLYLQLGQDEKALADFAKAIELDPNYWQAWHHRGEAYLKAGQTDKGLAAFSKAIELKPEYAGLLNARGLVYWRPLGQYEKALADFSRVIELDPKGWVGWYNRGLAYTGLHRHDKAIADYTKATELNPDYWETWTLRGAEYRSLGQRDKAVADYSRAIKLAPTVAMPWNNRGNLYNELGQHQKAIADCSKAIELDPKLIAAWNNRGMAYLGLHQYDKAIADYSKAIELDPRTVEAWNNRAFTYYEVHQYDKAIPDWTKTIELNPRSVPAWTYRGRAYAELGEWQKAASDLAKATELQKNDVSAWYLQAVLSLKLGDGTPYRRVCRVILDSFRAGAPDAALFVVWTCVLAPDAGVESVRVVELAEKLAAQNAKNRSHQTNLGAALYRAGQFKQAALQLDKAAALPADPFQAVEYAWFFLAMAHQRLGHAEEARQWLQKAQKQIEQKSSIDLPWNRRLTLQLLRRETETLLGTNDAKTPHQNEKDKKK